MTSRRTAACSCGQLQAHTVGEPIRGTVCHCPACQRQTGSAFSAQARFAAHQVTVEGDNRSAEARSLRRRALIESGRSDQA